MWEGSFGCLFWGLSDRLGVDGKRLFVVGMVGMRTASSDGSHFQAQGDFNTPTPNPHSPILTRKSARNDDRQSHSSHKSISLSHALAGPKLRGSSRVCLSISAPRVDMGTRVESLFLSHSYLSMNKKMQFPRMTDHGAKEITPSLPGAWDITGPFSYC